jgi:O-antigen ligase
VNGADARRPLYFALLTAAAAAIGWGTLAFGAPYPWAYTPLMTACAVVGAAGLAAGRSGRPPFGLLPIGLAAIGVAIAVQLAPLPLPVMARISPNADAFLREYDLSYGRPTTGTVLEADQPPVASAEALRHPLSIEPTRTTVGLALFAALALFLLGMSRIVSTLGAKSIVRFLVPFGVLVALVGIVQKALTAPDDPYPVIYGFWRPILPTQPFGPFVNPNHFAGWMLMVLPLSLAGFYDALLRAIETAPPRGRGRIGIVSSPDFGKALLFGLACLVMALALLMTRSRSGLAAFAVASVLCGWIVFRRQSGRVARSAVLISFIVLLVGAGAWAGGDAVFGKFVKDSSLDSVGGRVAAWKDTLGIIRRFPLTGTGFDTYGTAMVVYQTGARTLHFQEAHNDYLQIAAEGGLLVGIPVIFALAVFVGAVRRRFREAPKLGTTYWLRIGAVIGLVAIAVQSLVEFSLQMPGNAVVFTVLAAIALHRSPNLRAASDVRAVRDYADQLSGR